MRDSFDIFAEWPFIDDPAKIRVYNPKGNIAIVIGRVEEDPPLSNILRVLPRNFPLDHVAAIGTVWTLKHGIERIVQNLITNPYINTVILCGNDSKAFFPLAGLYCLKKHGINQSKHVAGYLNSENKKVFDRDSLVDLSDKDIEYFRKKKIRFINMIGHSGKLEHIFREIMEAVSRLEHDIKNPSFGFLRELDIYSWKGGKVVKARGAFPEGVAERIENRMRLVYRKANIKALIQQRDANQLQYRLILVIQIPRKQ